MQCRVVLDEEKVKHLNFFYAIISYILFVTGFTGDYLLFSLLCHGYKSATVVVPDATIPLTRH